MAIIGNIGVSIPSDLYVSIRDGVYTISKRPDLVAETAVAIRKATMKLHMADLWKTDLVEVFYTIGSNEGAQGSFRYTLDLTLSTKFKLYRRISSIRQYTANQTGYELQLKELDADRLLDDYNIEDINYWYQAGQQISIRADRSLTQLKIVYFKYPNILPAEYDSWIARQFPDAVIEEAAASVFKSIGKDSEAQRLAQAFNENLAMLRITQV